MILSVKHTTSTAHKLSNYDGKCANIHGHNYKFTVYLKDDMRDDFVLDFVIAKRIIKDTLDELYDHKGLVFSEDEDAEELEGLGFRITDYNPTVENIAMEAYSLLAMAFEDENYTDLLYSVEVEETDGCAVHYRP